MFETVWEKQAGVWRECLWINLALPWCSSSDCSGEGEWSVGHTCASVSVSHVRRSVWWSLDDRRFPPLKAVHYSNCTNQPFSEWSQTSSVTFHEPLDYAIFPKLICGSRKKIPLISTGTWFGPLKLNQKKLIASSHNALPTTLSDVNNAIFIRKYENRKGRKMMIFSFSQEHDQNQREADLCHSIKTAQSLALKLNCNLL